MLKHIEPKFEIQQDKDSQLEYTQISLENDHIIIPYFHREMWSQSGQWIICDRVNTPLSYICDWQNKQYDILDFAWKGKVDHPHFARTSDKIWFNRGKKVMLGTIGNDSPEELYEIQSNGELQYLSPNADDTGFTIIVGIAGMFNKIIYVDLEKQTETVVREGNASFGHLQMNPTDKDIIMYADQHDADNFQRMYTIRTDGREHFPFYAQKKGEWITHECWTRDGQHVTFIQHPNGLAMVDKEGENVESFHKGGYWHCHGGNDGTYIACDEWKGRINIIRNADGKVVMLTDHWVKEGEFIPQGPLHSHPCISYNEKHLAHVDGRTGQARIRIYELGQIEW